LQASNQFLHAPITMGLPLDMQVDLHWLPMPHFSHMTVQYMQALDFCAAAGSAEQQIATAIAAPNKRLIEFPLIRSALAGEWLDG
jgi:hypothetical protein